MLTRNKIKFINSLRQKKNREAQKLFIAEGVKVVEELIDLNWEYLDLYTTDDEMFPQAELIKRAELERISSLKAPNKVLGIFKIPVNELEIEKLHSSISLALDGIRDPGNLGTIIRIADWFGIKTILCSNDCVDVFNEKVVQSTMGSLSRVNVYYTQLADILSNISCKKYGAVLDGDNIYNGINSLEKGVIVMGSESHGISESVLSKLDEKISIPGFGGAESLNVSVSAGIICSEIFRK